MKVLIKSYRIFIIVLFISVISCNAPETPLNENVEPYFDLELYADNYIANENISFDVIKKVVLNGKEETKDIKAYDISLELEMIKKFNINKPSLRGKYKISEEMDGQTSVTTYTALEDDLRLKQLEVRKSEGEIISLKIEAEQKSILSDNKQSVIFAPEKSYHLISEDNNRFGKGLKKEILITF